MDAACAAVREELRCSETPMLHLALDAMMLEALTSTGLTKSQADLVEVLLYSPSKLVIAKALMIRKVLGVQVSSKRVQEIEGLGRLHPLI
jgi:hypothetical protein